MSLIEGAAGKVSGRLERERKTIRIMVELYCRGVHGLPGRLCGECRSLLEYALERIARCPFGERKPACGSCPVHCYRSREREGIRRVMRFAGPRMPAKHPVLAVKHFLDLVRGTRGG